MSLANLSIAYASSPEALELSDPLGWVVVVSVVDGVLVVSAAGVEPAVFGEEPPVVDVELSVIDD